MSEQDTRNGIAAAEQQARSVISDTTEKVKAVAADAGAMAKDYVREAGQQASAAAQTAYGTTNEFLDVVEGVIRENPWTALLLAGAAGYGLACLVKQQTR